MTIVEEIASLNHLDEKFNNGKPMDPECRLFVSDNYVIKIYYPKKFDYYYNELEVYKSLSLSEHLPNLLFYGESKNYKYIVLSKVDGELLFDVWDKLTNLERKHYLKEMAEVLKNINNIRSDIVNFKGIMSEEFNNSMSKLCYTNKTKEYLRSIHDANIEYINNAENASLIHVDTHFYNFMIDSKNRLVAYDFEHTIMAPKDYQLVRLYRMNYYPETFVYPRNSLDKKKIKKYSSVLFEIIKNYPQLINSKTNERMKVYLLNYLLKEINRCNISEEKALEIINENKKIRLMV